MQMQRDKLYELLGRLPDRNRPISANQTFVEDKGSYILEKFDFDFNGKETVPGYFLKTKKTSGPAPVIIYNHAHGGNYKLGKDEILLGRNALQQPPYGEVLTEKGYSVLCLDMWAFGERSHRSEQDIFKQMLWHGQVMWGMMLYDTLRGIDYVVSRSDVDVNRIGTLGLSMGSTMAWWLAALDTRIKVTIDLCCMTDFDALERAQLFAAHGIYYYVPDLLTHFSTATINELIAPRPHLSLNGNLDRLTPVDGLKRIDEHLKQIYEEQGELEAWKMVRYDVGHTETADMRKEVLAFLQKWM